MRLPKLDWTVGMLDALPEDGNRYQIIDGELFRDSDVLRGGAGLSNTQRVNRIRGLAGVRLVLASALLTACVHSAPGLRRPVVMSSERSNYSPVVRLTGTVSITSDSIRVAVDSGLLIVPGERMHASPVMMRDLYMTAMIALPGATEDSLRSLPWPWRSVAESDSTIVADSLRHGDTISISQRSFALGRTPEIDLRQAWVMFRISGTAVTLPPRLIGGPVLASRNISGGVRVFVCGERSIGGSEDRERSARMRANYSSAC